MDRAASFLVALAASAAAVGAAAWGLRDVRAISFEAPLAYAPARRSPRFQPSQPKRLLRRSRLGGRPVLRSSGAAAAEGGRPVASPSDARGIAVMPLDWFGEPEEAKTSAAGPSPPESPGPSYEPLTAPARPGVAPFARSAGRPFRAGRAAFPPPDELAAGVAVETRRASAFRLPRVTPAERSEAPELRASPTGREPAPPTPDIEAGRLELPPPLAEELLR